MMPFDSGRSFSLDLGVHVNTAGVRKVTRPNNEAGLQPESKGLSSDAPRFSNQEFVCRTGQTVSEELAIVSAETRGGRRKTGGRQEEPCSS